MKVNYSLSLKLTMIVISISAIAILVLAVVNVNVIEEDKERLLEGQFDKAPALIYALNISIGNNETLENRELLQEKLSDFKKWNEKILNVYINLPNENDELTVFASTDNTSINKSSVSYERGGEDYTFLCYKENNTYYIAMEETRTLVVLSPINISGHTVGTYEIVLSIDSMYGYLEQSLENRIQIIALTSTIILFTLLFGILYLLRRVIVKPIYKFRDAAKIFGKGNLDARVDVKSKDELGDLATAFNQMAKDLKESRDKIQDYNQILENLLQQKDEFIGQLGHDLKNPLQPLIGLLPMLIEQEKDPSIKEALQLMNKNAEYMRELILKTLQLAKLRSSNIKFDFEKLNLLEIADSVANSQKLMLKDRKIEIENRISKDIFVEADKLRLAEVFTNLIANSAKYTPEIGGKITLDAKKEDGIVKVSVKDTGIGMTETQLKRVFDEFYKADIKTGEYDSTGLGLSICKRIIDKHEGKIWAESPGAGLGSTFYFTLKSMDEK